jgi:phage repressor protein C with HTH and peptisase S24 domain
MKHEDVWRALDTLAAEHGLTASGLARKAGLDATTFNRSKRNMGDGRARWPSTESLSKVLSATGASLETFTALVAGARSVPHGSNQRGQGFGATATLRRVPLIGFAQAGADGFFDDGGYPVGGSWDEVGLPDVTDPHAYALEISGQSMEPVYRDGDIVVVSPGAPVRRGDRVVARARTGEVMAKELARRSARRVDLRSFNPEHPSFSFELSELAWLHRIVWASQ